MADNLHLQIRVEDFYNGDTSNIKNKAIVTDITSQKTRLLDVVEALGPVLTHEDKDIRWRGVEFLSWLLSQLPPTFLSEKELTFFANFYCDRLKDHHSIIPVVLQGILYMVNTSSISEKSTSELLHNIFQFVTCQSQLAQDRRTLYHIMRTCSVSHLPSVEAMGPDFMFGVIASMEGETDPQNLLLIFSFLPPLLSRLKVDHLTSDIFEVFSIYFPVDFTTVKKDDVIITREDLAEGLSNCLTSTPKLAAECIPMILEKLESSLKTAKLDSYKLLQRCCDRIESSQLEPSLNLLWKMIQRDLLPPMDAVIQQEALLALSNVVWNVSNSSETALNAFLDDVIVGVRSLISKPTDSLFVPSMKILEAVSVNSPVATLRVSMELQTLCRTTPRSTPELLPLLEALIPFLRLLKRGNPSLESIATFCLEAVGSDSEKAQNLAFVALQRLYGEMDEKLKSAVCDCLLRVNRVVENCRVVPECYNLLRLMTKTNPEEVSKLYKEFEALAHSGQMSVKMFLNSCAAVGEIPELSERVVQNYLQFAEAPAHSRLVLQSILTACKDAPVPFVYTLFRTAIAILTKLQIEEEHISFLQSVAKQLKEVVVGRDSDQQAKLMADNNIHQFITSSSKFPLKIVFAYEGLYGGLRADVCDSDLHSFGLLLARFPMNALEPQVTESASRLVGALVNKLPASEAETLLQSAALALDPPVPDFGVNVTLYVFALKGAIMRGLPGVEPYITRWFALLDQPLIGRQVAIKTECLVRDEPDFLNASCHCTIKYLYRQRLFSHLPALVEKLSSITDRASRDNYLLAMVHLASGVAPQVLQAEEGSVAAVVSQAMHSSEPAVVQPALRLLKTLLEQKSSLFADHVTSLLPVLLSLTAPDGPTPLQVRRAAHQCLFFAGCYPTHLTLPYKPEVVRALLPCLDDRKRVVRAEAARARSRWSLVGAVGEDAIFPS